MVTRRELPVALRGIALLILPSLRLESLILAAPRSSMSGGVLCRPLSAPAQESEQRWGVSDPAVAPYPRPRRRPAGSLTPHVPVSVTCWGARLMVAEICAVMTLSFTELRTSTKRAGTTNTGAIEFCVMLQFARLRDAGIESLAVARVIV